MTDELLRLKDALDESQSTILQFILCMYKYGILSFYLLWLTALLASVEEEKLNLASMVDRASKAGQHEKHGGDIDAVFASQIDELKVMENKEHIYTEYFLFFLLIPF